MPDPKLGGHNSVEQFDARRHPEGGCQLLSIIGKIGSGWLPTWSLTRRRTRRVWRRGWCSCVMGLCASLSSFNVILRSQNGQSLAYRLFLSCTEGFENEGPQEPPRAPSEFTYWISEPCVPTCFACVPDNPGAPWQSSKECIPCFGTRATKSKPTTRLQV